MAPSTATIVGFSIIGALWLGFQAIAIGLIIRNKRRRRRNDRLRSEAAGAGYKFLGSDVELAPTIKHTKKPHAYALKTKTQSNPTEVPQLPTDEDGGEDLEGGMRGRVEVSGIEAEVRGQDGVRRGRGWVEMDAGGDGERRVEIDGSRVERDGSLESAQAIQTGSGEWTRGNRGNGGRAVPSMLIEWEGENGVMEGTGGRGERYTVRDV
jgi:hypothetical protein